MLTALFLAIALAPPELRLELHRESLAGSHYRYRQFIDGLPVIGGEVNVTVRPDGSRDEQRTLAVPPGGPRSRPGGDLLWINAEGTARLVRRETSVDGHMPRVRYVEPGTGAVVREVVHAWPGKPARVFDPNPVVRLNSPGLRDRNDAAAAVPEEAYSVVDLPEVRESGPLGNPWVQIADFAAPFIHPADASGSLVFDRSESGFEDVNAFFHIDRTQRYLQALGYAGARAVAAYPVETDTHAAGGADNSFFIPSALLEGRGRLHFGEGGVDDAEDSDLVVHEYAHAIHEWISPGTFLGSFGSEARAISEGFGDYLAFAAKYEAALRSGRDPFCFADWDARCWEDGSEGCAYPAGSDCLRRLDSARTMADYLRSDMAGTEHRNGEIWSAALAEIFLALTSRHGVEEGRRVSDTLAVESFFGSPPNPGFESMARRMIAADRWVNGGRGADVICSAMMRRGILSSCAVVPRAEITIVPGSGTGVSVPDNDARGVTLSAFVSDTRPIERLMVSVNIRHSGRGELRVSLVAPDGTAVRLYEPSPERAPDLVTTFGRDSLPIDTLDTFRGRSAAGEWQLRVADVAFRDVATIVSWSLVIQFAGEEPATERPVTNAPRQVVPVVGHAPGANGTFYRTDLQLLNRGLRETEALLLFTPSGADGRTDFAAVRVTVPPETVVVLENVVQDVFGTAGLGQLEIAGDVIASSRTWTPGNGGTFGFSAAARPVDDAIRRGDRSYLTALRSSADFRSNVGFAEVGGAGGVITVRFRAPGLEAGVLTIPIAPHSHVQILVPFSGDELYAEVEIEGDGAIVAYGARVDNRSGDPAFVAGERASAERTVMIPAISSPGVAGTYWRTEYTMTNLSGQAATHQYVTGAAVESRELSGPAAQFDDVVETLFGRGTTRGVLVVHAPAGALPAARIWTAGPNGTYGQTVPFRSPSAAPVQDILHVEQSEAFRTNIGLLSDSRSLVRVTILDAGGATVHSREVSLEPLGLEQFQLLDPVVGGRARVEVLSGRVYAYGSLVDNRTGDAVFVRAQ